MMLLAATVGTVAGDGFLMSAMGCNCPHSGPATEYLNSPFDDDYSYPSFLMGEDAERKSSSKSARSDRSHTIFETAIGTIEKVSDFLTFHPSYPTFSSR